MPATVTPKIVERYRKVRSLARDNESEEERDAALARLQALEEQYGPPLLEAVRLLDMEEELTGAGADPLGSGASRGGSAGPSSRQEPGGAGIGSGGWIGSLLGSLGVGNPLAAFQSAKGVIDYLRNNPDVAFAVFGEDFFPDDTVELDDDYLGKLEDVCVVDEACVERRQVERGRGRREYVSLHVHIPASVWSQMVTRDGEIDAGRAVALVDFLDTELHADVEEEEAV